MEHFQFYSATEQLACIDPQHLLISESGHGVDDPHYNLSIDTNNNASDFGRSDSLSLEDYHESRAYEGPAFDEDADHESLDDYPLTSAFTSLDLQAPVFVPANQMELENEMPTGEELGLEALYPTKSPPTPRIEVSAPVKCKPSGIDHVLRATQKSRSKSRSTSPRGRSSSISRPRAQSNSRKSSPIPKAMATRLITTLESMPANNQGPYTVGDRTAALRDLHVHTSFPPPMSVQYSPYPSMPALAPGPTSRGYQCGHGGCDEHSRVWDTKSERDHHERKHVPKDRRAHVCGHCGMTFHFPKDLNRHVAAVHDKVRVICLHCGQAYSRKDNLERHIRTKHKYTQSSRSASQMSANSPTASTPVSYVQSPMDYTGRTTPHTLSPLDAKPNPWSKYNHNRHDSVNEPPTNDCHSPSDSALFAQPMFKSYSNRI